MQHLMPEVLGTLLLPVFVIVVFTSMAGIKPEAVLVPLFGLVGVLLKVGLDLAIVIVRVVAGGVMVILTRILNGR